MNSSIPPSLSVHKGWLTLIAKGSKECGLNIHDHFPGSFNKSLRHNVLDMRNTLQHMHASQSGDLVCLKSAKYVDPLTFGSYSLTLWTAPDLKTLLKYACDYCAVLGAPVRLNYHESQIGDAELWLSNNEPKNKESHVTYLGITLYLATLATMIQAIVGDESLKVHFKLVDFPYSESKKSLIEQHLNCIISEGSPIRKLCIERKYLHLPLPGYDQEIHFNAKNILRREAAELEKNDIVLQVYNTLNQFKNLENMSGEKVAGAMLLNIRTLNRRLAEVNTSYRGVLEKYKLERALHLLENPAINMTEIAFQLGFSDLSTFSRAFKRWTGKSPTKIIQ
ncbi:helix-turn-helix transcriptional regulator [Vibrio kyushuensis]|uniref:helix-turn-helix domain-containing protein n=1 Tax=Vibrio kyushuensis TaxID=2910249 RepID=UPI003D0C9DFA